jgi:C4-dicarboxylate transporter, DctM subunit
MIMLLLVGLFVMDFIDAVLAIIIFMPVINNLTEVGRPQSRAHGRAVYATLCRGGRPTKLTIETRFCQDV